jgi:hypothetical protein
MDEQTKPNSELTVMEVITSAMESFAEDEPDKVIVVFSTKGRSVASYSNCDHHERVGLLTFSLECAKRAWFKEDNQ